MRILIINRAMGTLFGGGEAFDSSAARYLAKAGHRVKVLTGRPLLGPPRHVFSDLDVDYIATPNVRRLTYATERTASRLSAAFYNLDLWLFERSALRWMAADGRHRRFDVVQVCGLFGLAERVLERWGIATIGWLPGIPSGRARRRIVRLARVPGFRLFSHGAPVAFVRERMGLAVEAIGPGLELDRIAAMDTSASSRDATGPGGGSVRRRLDIPDDAVFGVTVARLVPVKNLELLLEGLARAVQRVPNLYHVVVGGGPMRPALERRARALNLEARVRFTGHQEAEAVHAILATSDVMVLSSRYEGFSIAAIEAMAHGVPVIGTEVGYLQHLIRDSGAGLTVPPDDAEGLAGAIERMAGDRALREAASRRGKTFVERHAWPLVAEQLVALYEHARGAERVG